MDSEGSVLDLMTVLAYAVVASRVLLLVMVTSCWTNAVFTQLHTSATTKADIDASALAVTLTTKTKILSSCCRRLKDDGSSCC
jgi:hypothetical protein